jgi:hypothetical protein
MKEYAMTMTVGKDGNGTFGYEVHNGFDIIEKGTGYPTFHMAEASAKVCYHEMHRRDFAKTEKLVINDYMTLDEIFAELDI